MSKACISTHVTVCVCVTIYIPKELQPKKPMHWVYQTCKPTLLCNMKFTIYACT